MRYSSKANQFGEPLDIDDKYPLEALNLHLNCVDMLTQSIRHPQSETALETNKVLDSALLIGLCTTVRHNFVQHLVVKIHENSPFLFKNLFMSKKILLSDTTLAEAFYSPARFTPVVGVTPGTRYRTSIQELLHPRSYVRTSQSACHKNLRCKLRMPAFAPLPANPRALREPC